MRAEAINTGTPLNSDHINCRLRKLSRRSRRPDNCFSQFLCHHLKTKTVERESEYYHIALCSTLCAAVFFSYVNYCWLVGVECLRAIIMQDIRGKNSHATSTLSENQVKILKGVVIMNDEISRINASAAAIAFFEKLNE